MICYFFGVLANLLIFLSMASNCCKCSKKLKTKKGNHARKKQSFTQVEVTEHLSIHGTRNDEDLEFPNTTTEKRPKKGPIPAEKKMAKMVTMETQSDVDTNDFEKLSITDQSSDPKKGTPVAVKKAHSKREKKAQNEKTANKKFKEFVPRCKGDTVNMDEPTQKTKSSEEFK